VPDYDEVEDFNFEKTSVRSHSEFSESRSSYFDKSMGSSRTLIDN